LICFIDSAVISSSGGGSDVASLKTTAVRKGDDLIINGQKVSAAQIFLKFDIMFYFRRLIKLHRKHLSLVVQKNSITVLTVIFDTLSKFLRASKFGKKFEQFSTNPLN
jgi:hypothetical protein